MTGRRIAAALLLCLTLPPLCVQGAGKYGPGASDTAIKIGQTMPYSGPASAYASCGRANLAYFRMINDKGGIRGRKIELISLDDAYSPSKTVEQVRRLVEQEQVLLLFGVLSTGALSVLAYVNEKKIPHLFPGVAHKKFAMPDKNPWAMGWTPTMGFEGRMFARYILKHRPNAKIAILWEYDDLGIEEVEAFKAELGDRAAKMIVGETSYQVTDPTINSQLIALKATGADTLVSLTTAKFGSLAIRGIHDMGWHPLHLITYGSSSVGTTLRQAGLDRAKGLITTYFARDVSDPSAKSHPEVKAFLEWRARYLPDEDVNDGCLPFGYMQAALLVKVLEQCADDLTRENVMRQARSLRNVHIPMLLPGITVETSETDYSPIDQFQYLRFDGQHWLRAGEIMRESAR